MRQMGNILKIILSVILFFGLLFGVFYLLFFLDILKSPPFLNEIPIIGEIVSKDKIKKEPNKIVLLEEENLTLKETIDKKNQELKNVQTDTDYIEGQLKAVMDNEDQLKEEIINLNEQLINAEMKKEAQAKVYKDTAKYYAEMNAKNAAEIITKLEVEHIIGILVELEPDAAADILQNMPGDKAAEVTRKMLVTAP